MNQAEHAEKKRFSLCENKFVIRFRSIQKKISGSPSSYLFYCFLVPAVMMYLIYLAMEIHPFGDGTVLVLDLNGQYVYFFEALRNCILGDGSLLYSFFRAMGGEFVGMYAYYLASPFSYLVALFPQEYIQEALLTMILLKTGFCGFTFGYYLHKHSEKSNKIMVVAFSVMYALCSFAVVHQNNIMWTDALIWLPIVVYSIEELIKKRHFKLFVLSLSMTLLSNFYIGYMVCIFSALYFFCYYFSQKPEAINPGKEKLHLARATLRFGFFALLSAAISAFILLGAYYSLGFGKSTFSDPNWNFNIKFDFLDFFTKFLPGTYDTVRPEGLPFVYCGTLTLLMLPVYFLSKNISICEKLSSLFLIGFLIPSFIASPMDLIWHGFQNPNWLNYRYSFMLCFLLLVMAYKGFGNLRRFSEKFLLGTAAFLVLFVVVCQKQKFETYLVSSEKLKTLETVWLSLLAILILLVLLCILMRVKRAKLRESITGVLAAVICIEVFCSGLSVVVAFDDDVSYSRYSAYNNFIGGLRPIVNRVQEYDTGFYRMEKTMHRKTNDNMALQIRGLSSSTSTLNAETIAFLHSLGYTARSHLSQYRGGTPVSDSLLGIKYLIDYENSEKLQTYCEELFREKNYVAYENPYALSIAYGVESGIKEFDSERYNTYFERMNALVGTMLGEEKPAGLFVPVRNFDETSSGCAVNHSSVYSTYSPQSETGNSSFTYTIKVPYSGEYFFYTPPRGAKATTISVNGENLGEYLGGDTNHIVSLGYFEIDEEIRVTITLKKDTLSLINSYPYFWYLDEEVFQNAFATLKSHPQLAIDRHTDDLLTGTLTTAKAGQTILTTIPYDEGWQITLNGKKVENIKVMEALIAFDVEEAGTYEVELRYFPHIYKVGLILSVSGLTIFLLLCIAEIILKKTLFKKRSYPDFPLWVLEDFKEDAEALLCEKNATDSENPKPSILCRLLGKFRKKGGEEPEAVRFENPQDDNDEDIPSDGKTSDDAPSDDSPSETGTSDGGDDNADQSQNNISGGI